nr:glycosyltransferase family 1 protein [Pedobacter sp. JY14-1]
MNNLKTIFYDPQIFDIQDFGGISRYFSNLMSGVKESGSFHVRLPLLYTTNHYIQNLPQIMNRSFGKLLLKKTAKKSNWNKQYLLRQLKTDKYDLFHPSYYDPYFLDVLKKPLIITVHDMIYENFPDLFPDAEHTIENKKNLMDRATLIIAISDFTRQQIIKWHPQFERKIRVVHHGIPSSSIIAAKNSLPEKFLLYIGDRNAAYKNFERFTVAVAPLLLKTPGLHLVCAGGGRFNQQEISHFSSLQLQERIMQVSATDSVLKQLYQNAIALVYPSIEEGFGLPILEAFENQCPVACSNTSCLPEVGGSAVVYFDPTDQNSMRETLSLLLSAPEIRQTLKKSGLGQLRNFSFENSLNKTIACYQELI